MRQRYLAVRAYLHLRIDITSGCTCKHVFMLDFFPSISLHKLLVLTYSGLQLVETHRINFTERNLFSNANICRMKLKYSGGKKTTTKNFSLPLYGCLRNIYSIFRTELIFLSGRTMHLHTKNLSFSHAKRYANKNELAFPTPR